MGLSGRGVQRFRRDITLEEVKQHRLQDDAWTVLRGKVSPLKCLSSSHFECLSQCSAEDWDSPLFSSYLHSWFCNVLIGKYQVTVLLHAVCQVYNITPYIKFHPGGVVYIMKGAGRDATLLFNKYHAWVNADMLLENCLLGYLASPQTAAENGRSHNITPV